MWRLCYDKPIIHQRLTKVKQSVSYFLPVLLDYSAVFGYNSVIKGLRGKYGYP